jgi:hypothetical protein
MNSPEKNMKAGALWFLVTVSLGTVAIFIIKSFTSNSVDDLNLLTEIHSEIKVFEREKNFLISSRLTTRLKLLDTLSEKDGDSANSIVSIGIQFFVTPTYPERATTVDYYTFNLTFEDSDDFDLSKYSLKEYTMTPVVDTAGTITSLSYEDSFDIPFHKYAKIDDVSFTIASSDRRREQYAELEEETPTEILERLKREGAEKEKRERADRADRTNREESERNAREYQEAREKALRKEREAAERIKKEEKAREALLSRQQIEEDRKKLERQQRTLEKWKWSQIKIGMTKDEVISILGEPERRYTTSLSYGYHSVSFSGEYGVVSGWNKPSF